MTNANKIRKVYGILGAVLILAIPYVIMLQSTNEHLEAAQSFCLFKMLTGFPCPGCGITKSLIFLYQGQMLKSLEYHLFGPLTLLVCLASVIVLIIELITEKEYFRAIVYSKKIAYSLGFILATYHFTRIIYFISTNSIDGIIAQSIWR